MASSGSLAGAIRRTAASESCSSTSASKLSSAYSSPASRAAAASRSYMGSGRLPFKGSAQKITLIPLSCLESGFQLFQGNSSHRRCLRFLSRHLCPCLLIPGRDKNGIPAKAVVPSRRGGNRTFLGARKCLEGLTIIETKLHFSQRRPIRITIQQAAESACAQFG